MRKAKTPFVLASAAIVIVCGALLIRLKLHPSAASKELHSSAKAPRIGESSATGAALQPGNEASPRESLSENEAGYAKATFTLLVDRHRSARIRLQEAALHSAWSGSHRSFGWEKAYGHVQARLLALCYPNEVESMTLKIIEDPQSSSDDLIFASRVLGVLASKGSSLAETSLMKLIQGTNPEVVADALDELHSCDKDGKHRALYRVKCSEGMSQAFWSGPYWVDSQTKQTLTMIFERKSTRTDKDFASQEALERMGILESPDRSQRLEQLASYRADPTDITAKRMRWQNWALRVLELEPTENTLEILRRRLEEGEVKAARMFIGESVPFEPVDPQHPAYSTVTEDQFYDQVLLTYQALGGKLNPIQVRR